MFEVVLILNMIWFAMGFNVFSLRSKIFAKLLVPRDQRDTPVFDILAESGKFLGGFNLAFSLFNLLLLFNLSAFATDSQRAILLFVFAVAHGSQFFFNVPVVIQNRSGGGAWQVKGVIRFIFVTDFIMTCLNGLLAIRYLV
ncbi:hypothetical protein [Microbulbifer epialgicus]|uniref:MAPEG family protein n=1 Tax=Microbulbifer epialgicus TaxID=393907 RepID=A0ABV4P302_9GAMM